MTREEAIAAATARVQGQGNAPAGTPTAAPAGGELTRDQAIANASSRMPQQGPPMPSPDEQRQSRLRALGRMVLEQQGATPAFEQMKDAFTMGLRRPVGALAGALGGEVGEYFGGEPATFGERYKAGEDAYSDYMREQERKGGVPGTIASVVGGVASAGPLRGAIPSLGRSIAFDAGAGAVEGAARSEGDLADRAKDALIGGAVGGAVSGIVGGTGRWLSNRAANRAERTAIEALPEDLRTRSKALFTELKNAGVSYSPGQMANLESSALSQLRALDFDPLSVQHAPVKDAIDRIGRLKEAAANGSTALETLENLRTDIGAIANHKDPAVRRLAGPLVAEIDDFVARETPQQGMLNPDEITSKWGEARDLWRRKSKLQDLLFQADDAELRAASANSGQNTENTLRQNARKVLRKEIDPRTANRYTGEEQDAMRKVVEGTRTQNILRKVGNVVGPTGALALPSFASSGLMGVGAGLDPATAAVVSGLAYGGGRLAKNTSEEIAQQSTNELMRLVGTGSTNPLTQRGPTREALAALLAAGGARGYFGGGQ